MPRVFVSRVLPGHALDRLREAGHEVDVWPHALPPLPDELRDHVAGADALLAMVSDKVDTALLDAAPGLKVIANYGVGFDNIDLLRCRRRGVAVGNTPDVLTNATADLAFTLLLACARNLFTAAAAVRDGTWTCWEPTGFLGAELTGSRLVLVGGRGRIGDAMRRRAEGFGIEVTVIGRQDNLHAALRTADFVSLHAPLTDDTHELIDAEALALMPDTAILINTARGGIVNEAALVAALQAGKLLGAGLDVFEAEPTPKDNPLLSLPNVVASAHLAAGTQEGIRRMGMQCAQNIIDVLDNKPNPEMVVNKEAL